MRSTRSDRRVRGAPVPSVDTSAAQAATPNTNYTTETGVAYVTEGSANYVTEN